MNLLKNFTIIKSETFLAFNRITIIKMENPKIAIRISRSLLTTAGVFLVGYIIVTLFSLVCAFVTMDWDAADHMFNWNLIGKTGWINFRLCIVISFVVGQLLYWIEIDD